jgi:hypothetical protein
MISRGRLGMLIGMGVLSGIAATAVAEARDSKQPTDAEQEALRVRKQQAESTAPAPLTDDDARRIAAAQAKRERRAERNLRQ